MKMTPVVERWLAELRSDRYEQGHGYLRSQRDNVDRWCCLGVVAQALGREWSLESVNPGRWFDPAQQVYRLTPSGEVSFLDVETREELGLTENDQSDLTALNDGLKLPFSDIADVIEHAARNEVSIAEAAENLGWQIEEEIEEEEEY